jgi:LuxR family maltose regulon positive regulatory protein
MLAHLDRIAPLAERLRRQRDGIRIKLLRALALKLAGADGRPLFEEAHSLAQAYGLARIVRDTHPDLADWSPHPADAAPRASVEPPTPPRPTLLPKAPSSGLLTTKEGEILRLLAKGMSNKQIAQTLDVRDATIKWHVKNLFGKLGVGSRRHAVGQARLTGLLDDDL